MAKLPVDIPELVKQFGPTLNRVPAGGWVASEEEDKMLPRAQLEERGDQIYAVGMEG